MCITGDKYVLRSDAKIIEYKGEKLMLPQIVILRDTENKADKDGSNYLICKCYGNFEIPKDLFDKIYKKVPQQ